MILRKDDTPEIMTEKLSGGHHGAAIAIGKVFQGVDDDLVFRTFCRLLDERGIYGEDIWLVYKKICSFNETEFFDKMMHRNNGLESAIKIVRNKMAPIHPDTSPVEFSSGLK